MTAYHCTSAIESSGKVRSAVKWWWLRALRLNDSDEWRHTVSYLHGAIMTHPDRDIRADLRVLRDVAEEHAEILDELERREFADMLDREHYENLIMLQPQAD